MGRDPLVQHRLVVEAGKRRNVRNAVAVEPIEFDGENRTERGQGVEKPATLDASVQYPIQARRPLPNAVGSRSQSGGVSQMNARMAMTQTS